MYGVNFILNNIILCSLSKYIHGILSKLYRYKSALVVKKLNSQNCIRMQIRKNVKNNIIT